MADTVQPRTQATKIVQIAMSLDRLVALDDSGNIFMSMLAASPGAMCLARWMCRSQGR